ncbi:RNA polymerase sigma factor [Lysobacter korlensis]|uniref:RNA polymerase sigma factor n=1 Tax=Lysobacter korlensis TaxID=553636 RepID=A0ABV6RMT8_9GAMM
MSADHAGDDIVLLRSAIEGDSAAFTALFDRYEKRVLNVCWRIVQHREDAEDAAAIAFQTLWSRRHHVREVDGSVWPWLLTTTVNVCNTYRRGRGRYRTFLAKLRPEVWHVSATEVAEQRIEQQGRLGPTWTAFARLTADEQTILLLCVVEELPQADVARALGIRPGTVKSRLSRAKERLRNLIETESALRADPAGEGRG